MEEWLERVGFFARVCLEPPLCFGYLFLILAFARSRHPTMRTTFYLIFNITGIAGMATIVSCGLIHFYRDQQLSYSWRWLIYYAQASYDAGSMSHLVGFVLMTIDRLGTLNQINRTARAPSARTIALILLVQLLLPSIAQLHYAQATIRWNVNNSTGEMRVEGYGMRPAQGLLARSAFAILCSCYVVLNVAANAFILHTLRKLSNKHLTVVSLPQRRLHYYAMVTSSIFILNCFHQIFWWAALFSGDQNLVNYAILQQFWVLPITVFSSPALLLAMSRRARVTAMEPFSAVLARMQTSTSSPLSSLVRPAARNGRQQRM